MGCRRFILLSDIRARLVHLSLCTLSAPNLQITTLSQNKHKAACVAIVRGLGDSCRRNLLVRCNTIAAAFGSLRQTQRRQQPTAGQLG